MGELKKRKNEMVNYFDMKFEWLTQFQYEKKENLIEELEKCFTDLEKKIRSKLVLPGEVRNLMTEWKKEAENKMKTFTNSSNQLAFDLLYDNKKPPEEDIKFHLSKSIGLHCMKIDNFLKIRISKIFKLFKFSFPQKWTFLKKSTNFNFPNF